MSLILITGDDCSQEKLQQLIELAGLNKINENNSDGQWIILPYRQNFDDPSQVCTIVASLTATNEFISVSIDFQKKIVLNEFVYCTSIAFEMILKDIFEMQIQNAMFNHGFIIHADCHREYKQYHPFETNLIISACGYDTYGKFGYEMCNTLHFDHFRAVMAACECHAFERIKLIYDTERDGHERARHAWIEDGAYWLGVQGQN